MRKLLRAAAGVLLLALPAARCSAASTREYSVQVSAKVRVSPPQIELHWPADGLTPATSYGVYRKRPADTSWGLGVLLPGTATNYLDKQVALGIPYEYQVVRTTPLYASYGYLYSGIEVPMIENRGTLLLVVDKTYAPELAKELDLLRQDLTGDGWNVIRLDVARTDSVVEVKRLIQSQYQADPARVNCVFLFGHVPVPYSGDLVPDGHGPEHAGAWPCDGYYGDMEGVWTDKTVKDTQASDARNRNVPGDGKFDQSTFPAPLKLMVGRVDLAHMPGRLTPGGPATFPSEPELLRNYLHKDHQFRTGQLDLPRRGVVGDYFGPFQGEAFAASGWRNLSACLGAENITRVPEPGTWISTLSRTPCLWAYGCGPGTYESIAGFGTIAGHHTGTTVELVQGDIQAAFVLLYGSWLGDWDAEDDLLRAVLASPSCGLACGWSGRPHWFLQHMGLGEPIGYGVRLTQNNGPDGLYQTQVNTGAGQIHIALMGDPTLRLYAVAPPAHLALVPTPDGVTLGWTASSDSVLGYHVYRAVGGSFRRLTSSPVTGTSYLDRSPEPGAEYMVRALKLQTSASGSYYDLSQGAFAGPAGPSTPLSRSLAQAQLR
ncbi:MAG TPA: hypothetical protein VMU04_05045 [Candidatus Acidoferrum sp.]|nr:hypothetical protein [Candidatus Acidoferrum sp.]